MSWINKKIFWFSLLTLGVFLTDIYFYVNNDSLPFLGLNLKKEGLPSLKNEPSTPANQPLLVATQEKSSVTEAANFVTPGNTNYLNHDPETEELKLTERAKKLKANEIKLLKENSLDTSLNQDLRFESVYLLSKSNNSTKELAQIILSPIPETLKDRMLDFENIVRAQAIEGIQNAQDQKQSLNLLKEIMDKTDNVFLLDRMRQAQAFLENAGDSLEVQDQKQLEKVLGN